MRMNKQEQLDHNVKALEIIASEIGLRNAKVEQRQSITSGIMEYGIVTNSYLTEYDINFLKEQSFAITGACAIEKNELMIIVRKKVQT